MPTSHERGDAAPTTPEDFWAWWADQGARTCAEAIAAETFDGLVDELTARVATVAEGLAWELGPGRDAQHVLIVTAEGDPDLRAAARRWLRAAPAPTATWEYADQRPAGDLDLALRIGDADLTLDDVRVGVTRAGNHLDLVVHHPALATLPPEGQRAVAFLSLDAALGETDVETWVGEIDTSADPLPAARPLRDLAHAVAELKAELTDDGAPTWVLMQGSGPRGEVFVSATVPLSAATAPHLDVHLEVAVPYRGRTEQGFPDETSLEALRAFEDHLSNRLGASGRLVAHETGAGTRVLHYYVDSTTPGAAVVEAAVGGWTEGTVQVSAEHDPAWAAVRPFRT